MSATQPAPADVEAIGGPESFELLSRLVELAPTNLEDPAHGREEKRHYPETAELLLRTAKAWGLRARLWDAQQGLPDGAKRFVSPRPNVIVELGPPGPPSLLLLAHFDVVPVPSEQRERWHSPPHQLTVRSDGRWYGRGTNDDLGSGVVGTLTALRTLAREGGPQVGVRLILSPDEETGGVGGIEALLAHDQLLPEGSPERFLVGEAALLPDGSPYVSAGSSGATFLDITRDPPGSLGGFVELAAGMVGARDEADRWVSSLPSPDHPNGGGPHPTIHGRATLTGWEMRSGTATPREGGVRLLHLRAESDAANQIAGAVTLEWDGPAGSGEALQRWVRAEVRPPFSVRPLPSRGTQGGLQVVGRAGHAGYPHRASNPVEETVRLLTGALRAHLAEDSALLSGTLTLDLRSPPEFTSKETLSRFDAYFRTVQQRLPGARYSAPEPRRRAGYYLPADHPFLARVQKVYQQVSHRPVGIYGEYGGTDASALRELKTPRGEPLPAVVFGSMDESAHIHDAEESLLPSLLGEVERLLVTLVREWKN